MASLVRATAVGAVHPAGAGSLDAGAAGEGALEPEEGAGDLVSEGSVALLVLDAAMEETAAAGGGGSGVGVVSHVDGVFFVGLWMWFFFWFGLVL